MKTPFSTLLFLSFATVLSAQGGQQFGTQLGAGFGVSDWGIPVYVKFDTPLMDDISIGGKVAYSKRSFNVLLGDLGYRTSTIAITARGQYYFDNLIGTPDKYDVYAGVGIGFYIRNNSYDDDRIDRSLYDQRGGVGAGAFVGGRLFFSDNFALNAELGGGSQLSGAMVGISYRLN